MLEFWGAILCVCMLFGAISGIGFIVTLAEKVEYKTNQPLATECYVDDRIGTALQASKPTKERRWEGYTYLDSSEAFFTIVAGKKKVKVDCDRIDEKGKEVKIEWIYDYGFAGEPYKRTKWIPTKDFHKYHTLEELSEIVNKK